MSCGMTVVRREAIYTRSDNGVVGRGHRKERHYLRVRWHLEGQAGRCLPQCHQPGYAVCGFTYRREAKAAQEAHRATEAR